MAWEFWVYAGELVATGERTYARKIPAAPFWYASDAILWIAAAVQLVVVALDSDTCSMARMQRGTRDTDATRSTMSPLEIGGLGILALFALMLVQIPIGFAMIIVGVVGFALQAGWGPAVTLLVNEPTGVLSSAELATVPLFLLMGTFASVAGFSTDIYNVASAFLGHRRGGLAYATIGGSAAFGVVCGSSLQPRQHSRGQHSRRCSSVDTRLRFSTGTIAAGGTLKSLIPPSIVMILYYIVSKAFILDLFRAAIIPAILAIAVNLLAITLMVRFDRASAPVGERVAWPERWAALKAAAPVIFLTGSCVRRPLQRGLHRHRGGVGGGRVVATVRPGARPPQLDDAVQGARDSAAAETGTVIYVIHGALIFTYFLNLGRVPEAFVGWIAHLNMPPLAIIGALLVAYLILGAVFDEISAMLITLPLVLPVVQKLALTMMPGTTPEMVAVWWGIINVVIIELGMIIPPIGIIVFILHGLAPQIAIRTIYRGVVPFILRRSGIVSRCSRCFRRFHSGCRSFCRPDRRHATAFLDSV